MDIKIGEYIRTKHGTIGKVTGKVKWYKESIVINHNEVVDVERIKDGSKKEIIDLVECGDYVNGQYVECVVEVANKDIYKVIKTTTQFGYDEDRSDIHKEEIKRILTKERYERNCYNI